MEILKTQNWTTIYGKENNESIAVNNINLKVNTGEFVSIIGTSGSGKSTLLHMIVGVDTPTSGKVYINGKDIYQFNDEKLSKFRRNDLGLIYQFYNLIPSLNVVENITLPILLDEKEVDNNYLEEIIKLLGLENRKTHLPNELSGGEQQRVSIGRALINKPSIILADEPTGNLDSKNTNEIMKLLKTANEKYNQTIIMVTHDFNIAKYSNRIITLEDGKIKKDEVVKWNLLKR